MTEQEVYLKTIQENLSLIPPRLQEKQLLVSKCRMRGVRLKVQHR